MTGKFHYSSAICRIIIAQLIERSGFNGSSESVLQILLDLFIRYIERIGKLTASLANFNNRITTQLDDILLMLHIDNDNKIL